ncbi:MAG: PQQ-binding-like beta-propeller repeat protein [Gemmatimonadetes bacterium]|nr:PQQ-binding-like beta-propeller repeat protein [Gemmatimonadota bacterium]
MQLDSALELMTDGAASAIIVTPVDGSLDSHARQIVACIRTRLGVTLDIVSDSVALDTMAINTAALQPSQTRHVLALGCLANNRLIASVYQRFNTLVDRWYPGAGGFVLQTIMSPYRMGDHMLVVGGSDVDGVAQATQTLLRELEATSDGRLPWRLEVQLGDDHLPLPEDRMDRLGMATSEIPGAHSALPETPYEAGFRGGSMHNHLLRLGMYGPHADNMHLSRSSQLGLRYLYSGRSHDAAAYRSVLLEEAAAGVIGTLYHYKSVRMFQLWALLRGAPVFDEDDRTLVDTAIRNYLLHTSGLASKDVIRSASDGVGIFSRHIACEALNLWIGADWLWRLTGEQLWLQEQMIADDYFDSQAGTDVPLTGLTEGYASYLEVVLEWMLWSCPARIASDPHIRIWAQRVLGLCTNAGQLVLGPQTDTSRYPYHLLRRLSYLLDDGSYLFVAHLREEQVRLGNDRLLQFSAGQAYASDVEARKPESAQGFFVHPMNERLRQWKASSIPAGAGFDRIEGRSGWSTDDDYLLVVGVRSGGKSLPNVGNLAAYERFGQRLITSHAVPLYPRSGSAWRHSTVTVNVGGCSTGIAAGAHLLDTQNLSGGHLLSYRVDAPGLYSWTRELFWKPEAYLLAIDRVHLERDEPSMMSVNWRCGGEIEQIVDSVATICFPDAAEQTQFFVHIDAAAELTAMTDHYPALGMPPGSARIPESMLHATRSSGLDTTTGVRSDPDLKDDAAIAQVGRDMEVLSLLHAVEGPDNAAYHLVTDGDGWIIEGPDGCRVSRGQDGTLNVESIDVPTASDRRRRKSAPRVIEQVAAAGPSPAWQLELRDPPSVWTQQVRNRSLAVGTESGDVIVVDPAGVEKWSTPLDTPITALRFADDDLLAGTESGQIVRFDAQGQIVWSYDSQFRSERDFWPWWFLPTPRIGALACGKDTATGQCVVAAGTGSTSLNFLDGDTGALLADVVSPYGLPDRIQSHVSSNGEMRFFEGHSWLTCGSSIRAWVPPNAATTIAVPMAHDQPAISYSDSVDAMGRSTEGWDTCGVVDFWVGRLEPQSPLVVIVLRHGAVNQLTAYEEETGKPLWDMGIGGSPVALAVLPGRDTAAARCYVAEQFGWVTTVDGQGQRVTATRIDTSLTGMSVKGDHLVLWNQDRLYLTSDTGQRAVDLGGVPLGWFDGDGVAGMLSTQADKLVFTTIPDGP